MSQNAVRSGLATTLARTFGRLLGQPVIPDAPAAAAAPAGEPLGAEVATRAEASSWRRTGVTARPALIDTRECRRRARRKPMAFPAAIVVPGLGGGEIACTVVDMSGAGARVKLPPAAAQKLGGLRRDGVACALVLKRERMEVACEIAWRDQTSLGLRFTALPARLSING